MLTQLKKEIVWLNDADSIALQQSLKNLDVAYKNFFKNGRGYPKYKSKKNHRQTYRTMNVHISGKRIKLPKIGAVKFKQSRDFHGKISNARLDFLHKESTRLCRENQTIAVESIQVKNLLKNHKLAKSISDVSWGEFFRQLTYKSILYGCDLIKVPTFYPSSQTCHQCGYKNPITKNLNVRSWICPNLWY